MTDTPIRHPAPFTDAILVAVEADMAARGYPDRPGRVWVLDPFAGTGKVHALPYHTMGIELEAEWAAMDARTMCADSLEFMDDTSNTASWDVVVTSPCYGNRFADHHVRRDPCSECRGNGRKRIDKSTRRYRDCPKCRGTGLSPRRSYAHDLGRAPSAGSSATLHYGPAYRDFHRRAWRGVYNVLVPGGLFYLNSKDFIRNHRRVRVSDWHRRTCIAVGFEHVATLRVSTPGMRYGQNGQARVRNELVYVLRKPEVG